MEGHMKYSHIVVPLDGSDLAECILPYLDGLASEATNVELVRVVSPVEMHYKAAFPIDARGEKDLNQALIKEAENYLQKAKAKLSHLEAKVSTSVLTGSPAAAISDYIKKTRPDLLLIASHGRSGPSRWVWGSTADKLLHSIDIPVFLVRPPGCVVNQ
jgi:nucleotide-binding universal stress UspA family protein